MSIHVSKIDPHKAYLSIKEIQDPGYSISTIAVKEEPRGGFSIEAVETDDVKDYINDKLQFGSRLKMEYFYIRIFIMWDTNSYMHIDNNKKFNAFNVNKEIIDRLIKMGYEDEKSSKA